MQRVFVLIWSSSVVAAAGSDAAGFLRIDEAAGFVHHLPFCADFDASALVRLVVDGLHGRGFNDGLAEVCGCWKW